MLEEKDRKDLIACASCPQRAMKEAGESLQKGTTIWGMKVVTGATLVVTGATLVVTGALLVVTKKLLNLVNTDTSPCLTYPSTVRCQATVRARGRGRRGEGGRSVPWGRTRRVLLMLRSNSWMDLELPGSISSPKLSGFYLRSWLHSYRA